MSDLHESPSWGFVIGVARGAYPVLRVVRTVISGLKRNHHPALRVLFQKVACRFSKKSFATGIVVCRHMIYIVIYQCKR